MSVRSLAAALCVAALVLGGCAKNSSSASPSTEDTAVATTEPETTEATRSSDSQAEDRADMREVLVRYCASLASAWRAFNTVGPGDGWPEIDGFSSGPLNEMGSGWWPSAASGDKLAMDKLKEEAGSMAGAAREITLLQSSAEIDGKSAWGDPRFTAANQTIRSSADEINRIASQTFGITNCNGS